MAAGMNAVRGRTWGGVRGGICLLVLCCAPAAHAARLLWVPVEGALSKRAPALRAAAKEVAAAEKLTFQEADASAWTVCPGAKGAAPRDTAPCDEDQLKAVPAAAVLFASAVGNAVHLAVVLPDVNRAVHKTLPTKGLKQSAASFLSALLENRRLEPKIAFDPSQVEVDGEVPDGYDAPRVIRRYTSQLHFCAQRDAQLGNDPRGTVTIHFVVGRTGRVSDVDLIGVKEKSPGFHACLSRVAGRMRFGRHKGAEAIDIEATVAFSATLRPPG